MEHASGYEKKRAVLLTALETFEKAMRIDDSKFSGIEQDTIQSGKVQKFEVCVELFWKMNKKFLFEIHGIEAVSPKMVIKALYRIQYVDEAQFDTLIEMINDRNRLSHIYSESQFNEIYARLPMYLNLLRKVLADQ